MRPAIKYKFAATYAPVNKRLSEMAKGKRRNGEWQKVKVKTKPTTTNVCGMRGEYYKKGRQQQQQKKKQPN